MINFFRYQVMRLHQFVTGRRILTCLDELNDNQWLSYSDLLALQRRKLYQILVYSYQYVPYYQRIFDEVGFHPDEILTDLNSLHKVPVLTKSIISQNFEDMMTIEPERRASLSQLTTGGSTGQPLVFMQDSNFRDYVTADIHRHLGWVGWKLGQLHAYIWGANFEVSSAQSLRTHLMDWILNRFTINAYVLSDETMMAFAERIQRQRPHILFGYASSLHRFAQFVRQNNFNGITFDGIFSSAEVLYPAQRAYIEETFNCKMFNRYGTRDLGGVACECKAHLGLHASIDNNYIEVLNDLDSNEVAQLGETGHLIVTNLNNYGMPFIRYDIEDVAAWSVTNHCLCGRQLPLIELVYGRQIDMFKTKDGRSVWGGFASPLFGMKGVKQFQLIQKSLDLVVVRIVKSEELDNGGLAQIERTVKIALGDHVDIEFEFPDAIKVYDSGKYRYAISEV